LVDLAENIIKNSKKIVPAILNGEKVRSYYIFKINICANGKIHISHFPQEVYDRSLIVEYTEILQ
jgi:hypothetical protein